MYIKEIQLRCFRSHFTTRIGGLQKFTVFLGPNGAGKSTILDAIGYALTGVCRGIDDRGSGADWLVTRPEYVHREADDKPMAFGVALTTTKGQIVRGLGEGPKSKVQAAIGQKYGIDPILARALVQTASFTKLPPATQKSIVLSVAGSQVSDEEIHALLGPAAGQFAATSGPLGSIEAVEQADKALRTLRPELKRQIAEMVIPEEVKAAGNIQDAISELAALRSQRDNAVKEMADYEARKKMLQHSLTSAKETLSKCAPGAPGGDVKKIEAEIKEIEQSEKVRGKEYDALRSEVDTLAGRLEQAKRQFRAFMELKGSCPTCQRPITKSDSDAVTKRMKDEGAKMGADLKKRQARLEQLAYDQDRGKKLLDLKGQMESIRDYQRSVDYWKSAHADATKTVKECEAELAKPAPKFQDVTGIDKEIAEGEEYIGKQRAVEQAAAARTQAVKQKGDLETHLSNLEELIEKLGPKGPIRARFLQGGGDEFLAEVNAIASEIGLAKVAITMEGGFSIYIGGSPAELLSASEDYRLNLAFAAALAKRSGTGLLLLDAAEVLDGENRDLVNDVLAKAGLEQAFLAATPLEMPQGSTEPSPGWSVFAVTKEKGLSKVSPLGVPVEA